MDDMSASKLREPFKPELVGKLPRVTCKDCSDKQRTCTKHQKAKCQTCGAYISTAHIHLDYVGHAAVTDRLLQVDPEWTWEPMASDPNGFPVFDTQGGLWIRLTVAGVTRPGYGEPGKIGPKEAIGDALRNAAMRFGVGLDLWSKEGLGDDEDRAGTSEPARAHASGGADPPSATTPPAAGTELPPDPLVRATDEQWREIKQIGLDLGRRIGADEAAVRYAQLLDELRPLNPATLTSVEAATLTEMLQREVKQYAEVAS